MKIEKVTGSFGGRVTGLDVSKPLTMEQVEALETAVDDRGVLFFPHQPVLTAEEQLALAAQFGTIETPPLLTKQSEHPQVLIVEFENPKGSGADVWHQDGTHLEVPPKGTFQASAATLVSLACIRPTKLSPVRCAACLMAFRRCIPLSRSFPKPLRGVSTTKGWPKSNRR